MQPDTPQCKSGRIRKLRVRGGLAAGKPDSSEWGGDIGIQMDSERAQCGNSLRQQSFSARFVNRRSAGVKNNRSETFLIRGDRRRDSRRPRSNYDDVGVWVHWKVTVEGMRCPHVRRSCILPCPKRLWVRVAGGSCEIYFSCFKMARAFFKSLRFSASN